jgi:hypothetical protein
MFLRVSFLALLTPTARCSVKDGETDLSELLHFRSLAALVREFACAHIMPVPSGISDFNFTFA